MPTDDPRQPEPGLLPTPFTADEIRAGCPEGHTVRLRVTEPDGTSYRRLSRYTGCDEAGATIESWRVDEHGLPVGDVHSERSTWRELQEHASFPADRTTVEPGTLDLATGSHWCWVYTVGGTAGPRFWFADAFPGMPVRFEIPTADGVETTEMIGILRQ